MCGLAFHYTHDQHPEAVKQAMNATLRRLQHRGPDENGLYTDTPAYFAHARLSIVDLNDSHQPMHSPDQRYTLVFNGEIYNHKGLRNDLANKWTFITKGDTEVILAGLILEGEKFLTRMQGMWAFAFWDSRTQRLLLSRDRMGEKPLYYFQQHGRFSCASELPALRCLATSPWSEDLDSSADYFRFGYCLPGYTSWEQVFEVLPGHWLSWRPGAPIEQHAYWKLNPPGPEKLPTNDDDLRHALGEAVRSRLLADVEIGAFLSGGIDSSLICALAQEQINRPLKTYTIGFNQSAYDESRHAADIAAFLGTDHHCEIFTHWDEKLLESLLHNHLGQPFSDSSLLPTALVSRVAAGGVKVSLSGDGADELFGGYQRYQARIILRWYSRLPDSLKKISEKIIRAIPEPMTHHSRNLLKKAHLFVDIAMRQRAETPYIAPLMFHPDEYATLFPDLVGLGHTPHGLPQQSQPDDLQQMLYSDSLIYLPQDILAKVDRASMASSLETRAPFLDHKVVELAFQRNAHQHLSIGSGKKWIRKAFHDKLPEMTWNRRKQGFGVPVHQWFRGELGGKLVNLLANQRGPIRSEAALRMLCAHKSGARDHGHRLWMLFVYLSMQNYDQH